MINDSPRNDVQYLEISVVNEFMVPLFEDFVRNKRCSVIKYKETNTLEII